jgi:hypothetical protein
MKFLNLLGVDLNSPSTISTFSTAAQGKSTLMTYFVKELHDNGKTISIISDDSNKIWLNRLRNIGCQKGQPLIHKELPYQASIFEFINKQKDAIPDLNCVIVDRPFESNDRHTITELCDFIRENNMMLFVAQNTRRLIGEKNPSVELTRLQNTDLGLSLYRKPVTKLAWYKRLINLFAKPFGKTPYVNPNVTLKVVKNKYGKDGNSLDIFLDFKKVNNRTYESSSNR